MKTRLQRTLKRIFIPASARPGHRRGEGFANGIEIVGPPIVLLFVGLWLDGKFATSPLFTISLFLIGAAGSFASQYYQYQEKMRAHDEGKPWARAERDVPRTGSDGTKP